MNTLRKLEIGATTAAVTSLAGIALSLGGYAKTYSMNNQPPTVAEDTFPGNIIKVGEDVDSSSLGDMLPPAIVNPGEATLLGLTENDYQTATHWSLGVFTVSVLAAAGLETKRSENQQEQPYYPTSHPTTH